MVLCLIILQTRKFFCILILINFTLTFSGQPTFSRNGLTLDVCTDKLRCIEGRQCVFPIRGKLYECEYTYNRQCLCAPTLLNRCVASSDCELGERCMSTPSGEQICVSCVAAIHIPTFLAVDNVSKMDCQPSVSGTTPESTFATLPNSASTPFLQSPDASAYTFHSTPTPEFFPRGFGFDGCFENGDCEHDYECRVRTEPLVGALYKSRARYIGSCSVIDPNECTHADQCFPEEYCVSGVTFKSDTFGVCMSVYIVNAYYKKNFNLVYFPPGPNTDPDVSASPFFSPTAFNYESPQQSPLYSPAISEPGGDTTPSIQYEFPTSTISAEASVSDIPSFYNFNSGYTMDICSSDYDCRGYRKCVDFFGEAATNFIVCEGQCYCLPLMLQKCLVSSDCVQFEVCAKLPESEASYCISEDAVKGRTQFDYLPRESVMFSPEESSSPLVSGEPQYIPPGYPVVTPEPSITGQTGLTFSLCISDNDCAEGYACISTGFAPCSSEIEVCLCIANKGSRGTFCVGDEDCPLGEICYPQKTADIYPSYCISIGAVNLSWLTVGQYFSVIIPRGVGKDRRRKEWRDWRLPPKIPEQAGGGAGLTGDVCRYSSECSKARLCIDVLSFGELCDFRSNCSKAFCYPEYFEPCDFVNSCDEGEICAPVWGFYRDDVDLENIIYTVKERICISATAAQRNGYSPIPEKSPLPKTLVSELAWKDAAFLIELKLNGEQVTDTNR